MHTPITTDNFKKITMERKKHTLKQTNPLRTRKQKIKNKGQLCKYTYNDTVYLKSSKLLGFRT